MPTFLSRVGYYVAIVGGLIGAMFLGSALGSDDYPFFIMCVISVAAVTWIIMAGEAWWLPMCFAVGIGGFITIPYKIYPHELALLLCAMALIPRIAFRPVGMKKKRASLPAVFYVTLAYLCAHYVYSLVTNGGDFQTNGNITRAYVNALWPFIFGLAYYLYGDTRNIRTGLTLMYCALVLRLCFGLVNYFLDDVLIVPVLNYSVNDQDLRGSGSMLLILSGLMLFNVRSPVLKIFHAFVFFVAGCAFMFGGSRGMLIGMIFFALFLCVALQRWLTMTAVGLAFAAFFVIFNAFPSLLDPLPYRVERALSIMVFRPESQRSIHEDLRGSDEFHAVLRTEGLRRWTADPKNLVVGTGIKPFDVGSVLNVGKFEIDPFSLLTQMCADNGGYESALWAVLAVLGIVGLLLYAGLLIPWLIKFFRVIQSRALRGENQVVMLWACASIATWFALINYVGSFPSFEIFLSVIALAIVEDRRNANVSERGSLPAAIAQALQLPQPERRRVRELTAR